MEINTCAWSGTVNNFLAAPETAILASLTKFLCQTDAPQLFAWDKSIRALKDGLEECLPEAADCGVVLEYDYPRSGGRRPDLIFLNNGTVLVIEFKNRVSPEQSDFDQVLGYVRDLSEYHSASAEKNLIPILVPIGFQDSPYESSGVKVVGPKGLAAIIRDVSRKKRDIPPDVEKWVSAQCEPLPALIEAARLLFEKKPLPRIKQAESAKIPETVSRVETIANRAIKDKTRSLILITGVPGAGKTLVGLQCAHTRKITAPSVFLSGNGPLVNVLQYELDSKALVLPMKTFLHDAWVKQKTQLPRERVLIFDEAQRAWDRDRVLEKHRGALADSEAALLLALADRGEGGFVVIALLGEGQEIHAGEESGIGVWVDAIKEGSNWEVFGPEHLAKDFRKHNISFSTEPLFHLTASLRSMRAVSMSQWAALVLEGKTNEAYSIAIELKKNGFPLRITRDLGVAKQYVLDRMSGRKHKRCGMIVSSKFRKCSDYGVEAVRNNYYYYGQWYGDDGTHPHSGSRLEQAVSEFGCQGLELDLPLLCWGTDLRWEEKAWIPYVGRPRVVKDPQKLRFNAYRVLLTRGREGLVTYVPKAKELDSTYDALLKFGFEVI